MNLLRSYSLILTILLSLVILCLTLTVQTGTQPGIINDKLAHFLAFAALVFPHSLAHKNSFRAVSLWALFLGGAIEIIQPYVGRQGDWFDYLADLLGVITGVVLAKITASFKQV